MKTFDHDENAAMEDALESLKDEARVEGYQQGYLAALDDIELHVMNMMSDDMWYGLTAGLRKMVTSK